MNKIIIANWKMNPETEKEAVRLARASDFRNVVIAPPFPFLSSVGKNISRASLGAQNVFFEKKGPYTGEVSPGMLKKIGVKYVIIGHSERRAAGESEDIIAKKTEAAIAAELNVVLCVGESQNVREEGISESKAFVRRQITSVLRRVQKLIREKPHTLIVAYEPIWAIGSGKPALPEDASMMSDHIVSIFKKKFFKAPEVLYGGSIDARNAGYFLEKKSIGGLLVGGASLDGKEFATIAEISRRFD